MTAFPDYSVLMSVYARDDAGFLQEAVTSMLEQTVPFHDLVLVCDGPLTDELDTTICALQSEMGGRLVLHRLAENGGLGVALSAGLPLCGCDIVARMDSDDVSRSDRCELLLKAMAASNLDLVGGAIEEFDQIPGDMGSVRRTPTEQSEIERFAKRRNPFNHMTVMFRRETVLMAGGYQDFYYLEDYWLWVRMIASGCKCANVPNVVLDARVGHGMYARRSNATYLSSQVAFFSQLRRMGFINWAEWARAITERAAATVIPAKLVRAAYNSLLRRKS